jgi:pantoate--beta-alanine ligase
MKLLTAINDAMRLCKSASKPLVIVPTMGALHRGHAALIRRARHVAGRRGTVMVTIFVNPTQFGPKEDLARYPRPLRADCRFCRDLGVDLLFHPRVEMMYPAGFSTFVDAGAATLQLCGRSRPGHFRGVCTVVLKLFAITGANAAVFGLKDFQQYVVISRMVKDLNIPIRLIPVPTVREPDGLALSSRNLYLTPEERTQASVLQRALRGARAAFRRGERRASSLRGSILSTITTAPLARIDYVEIVDGRSLLPVRTVAHNTVFAVAAFFGKTRLIDNLWIRR